MSHTSVALLFFLDRMAWHWDCATRLIFQEWRWSLVMSRFLFGLTGVCVRIFSPCVNCIYSSIIALAFLPMPATSISSRSSTCCFHCTAWPLFLSRLVQSCHGRGCTFRGKPFLVMLRLTSIGEELPVSLQLLRVYFVLGLGPKNLVWLRKGMPSKTPFGAPLPEDGSGPEISG